MLTGAVDDTSGKEFVDVDDVDDEFFVLSTVLPIFDLPKFFFFVCLFEIEIQKIHSYFIEKEHHSSLKSINSTCDPRLTMLLASLLLAARAVADERSGEPADWGTAAASNESANAVGLRGEL